MKENSNDSRLKMYIIPYTIQSLYKQWLINLQTFSWGLKGDNHYLYFTDGKSETQLSDLLKKQA